MAQTKALLGAGVRLTDLMSASLMARVVSPQIVNEVLDANGCEVTLVFGYSIGDRSLSEPPFGGLNY